MRVVEVKVYTFDELNDKAKERARQWFRAHDDGGFNDEYKSSIEAFIDHFGAKMISWNIGPYAPIAYDVAFNNSNFRGVKLRDFDRDFMPTGFCGDCALWTTFYDAFKRTGNAKGAFEDAIHTGFSEWRNDLENSLEDEQVDDALVVNEYEFYENGEKK